MELLGLLTELVSDTVVWPLLLIVLVVSLSIELGVFFELVSDTVVWLLLLIVLVVSLSKELAGVCTECFPGTVVVVLLLCDHPASLLEVAGFTRVLVAVFSGDILLEPDDPVVVLYGLLVLTSVVTLVLMVVSLLNGVMLLESVADSTVLSDVLT